MKRYLVVLVIVLVAGAWVAGFAPEYSARHEAEAERDRLQQRVDAADERLRMTELLGQALALGDLVREQRFGEAQPLSSTFFDGVRAESQRVREPAFSGALLEVLEARDATTAALSRGEAEAAVRIAQFERRLRRALGFTVPGGVPPSVAAAPEASESGQPELEADEPAEVEPLPTPRPEPTPSPTPTPRA